MSNKRIYELAKELNQPSKDVVEKAQQLGINVKNHMGTITTGDEKKLQQASKNHRRIKNQHSKPAKSQPQTSRMNKRNKKQKRNNKKITATIKIAVKGAVK